MSEQQLIEIASLSREERIEIMNVILDSFAAEADTMPLSNELRQELDRRLADYEANPDDVATWEDVKARLQSQP